MNEHSQLQVLIAKQIRPLAQQLGYLLREQPEGRNNGKLSACKRALTNNTEFSIILKVIKRDFFLACCYWRRCANTRCWWLGRNFWLHFRHGHDGLNHIDVTWEAWKEVHRNLHCLLLDKHQEKKIHFIWRYLDIPDGIYPNTLHFSRPLLPITHCQTSSNLIYSIALHNIWGARHVGISRTPILITTSVSCPISSDS